MEEEYYIRRVEGKLSITERTLLMIIAELNKPPITPNRQSWLNIRRHIIEYEKNIKALESGLSHLRVEDELESRI